MNRRIELARRDMLAAGGAALLLGTVPAAAHTAPAISGPGRKFHPDGRVHPFAGNTVVCHLDQQGPRSTPFNILLDYYRQAPGRTYARKFTLLPPSSYHMTVFGGANNVGRQPGQWLLGLSPQLSMEECNRIVGERIKSAAIEPIASIRMKIDDSDSGYDGNTLRIPLVPIDAAEAKKIRTFRDRLSQAIGIRSSNHDSYQFHVTLGYLIRTFSARELREAEQDMRQWKQMLAARTPVIELGRPEYCVFDDMFAFHRQFFI